MVVIRSGPGSSGRVHLGRQGRGLRTGLNSRAGPLACLIPEARYCALELPPGVPRSAHLAKDTSSRSSPQTRAPKGMPTQHTPIRVAEAHPSRRSQRTTLISSCAVGLMNQESGCPTTTRRSPKVKLGARRATAAREVGNTQGTPTPTPLGSPEVSRDAGRSPSPCPRPGGVGTTDAGGQGGGRGEAG